MGHDGHGINLCRACSYDPCGPLTCRGKFWPGYYISVLVHPFPILCGLLWCGHTCNTYQWCIQLVYQRFVGVTTCIHVWWPKKNLGVVRKEKGIVSLFRVFDCRQFGHKCDGKETLNLHSTINQHPWNRYFVTYCNLSSDCQDMTTYFW